jgi:hypothetical protein
MQMKGNGTSAPRRGEETKQEREQACGQLAVVQIARDARVEKFECL